MFPPPGIICGCPWSTFGLALGAVHPPGLAECVMMTCTHCYSVIRNSLPALKVLRASSPAPPSLPPPPDNCWSFYLPPSFAFPECHAVGDAQYVSFSEGLLSLRYVHLRFLHAFSWLDGSFLLVLKNIPSCG